MDPFSNIGRKLRGYARLEEYGSEEKEPKSRSRSPSPTGTEQRRIAQILPKFDPSKQTRSNRALKKQPKRMQLRAQSEKTPQTKRRIFAPKKPNPIVDRGPILLRETPSDRKARFDAVHQQFILQFQDKLKKINYLKMPENLFKYLFHDTESTDAINQYFAKEISKDLQELIQCIGEHAGRQPDCQNLIETDKNKKSLKDIASAVQTWMASRTVSKKMTAVLVDLFEQIDTAKASELEHQGLMAQGDINRNAESAKYSVMMSLLISPVAANLHEYLNKNHKETPFNNERLINMIKLISQETEPERHELFYANLSAGWSSVSKAHQGVKTYFQGLIKDLPVKSSSFVDQVESSSDEEEIPQGIQNEVTRLKLSEQTMDTKSVERLADQMINLPPPGESTKNLENLIDRFEKLFEINQTDDYDDPDLQNQITLAAKAWLENLQISQRTKSTIAKLTALADKNNEEKPGYPSAKSSGINATTMKYALVQTYLIAPLIDDFSTHLAYRVSSELSKKIIGTLDFLSTPRDFSSRLEFVALESFQSAAHNEGTTIRHHFKNLFNL